MPPPRYIIDSHLHLWPASDANTDSHAWMSSEFGSRLAGRHCLDDYLSCAVIPGDERRIKGLIYIETDRWLYGEPTPSEEWVREPLKELLFIRRTIESSDSRGLIKGIVPMIPLTVNPELREWYLAEAERFAGQHVWKRVKGFRCLLQDIVDEQTFSLLVLGQNCIANLQSFTQHGRRWAFDIGVDQNHGGVWQLELVAEMIERVNRACRVADQPAVTFVLNHLCKPSLHTPPMRDGWQRQNFARWYACMNRFSSHPNVYMKLSGAFSELVRDPTNHDSSHLFPPSRIIDQMKPWLDVLFAAFPPWKIMFGSDWPVCNVGGTGNESWGLWRNVVEEILERYEVDEDGREWIWWRTAEEAYRLNL